MIKKSLLKRKSLSTLLLFPVVVATSCDAQSRFIEKYFVSNTRFLIEHEKISKDIQKKMYYFDTIIVKNTDIDVNVCNIYIKLDENDFQNYTCYFGRTTHITRSIRKNKNKYINSKSTAINDFDISDDGICLFFPDLTDFESFPSLINININFTFPIFFCDDCLIIKPCIWAPNLSVDPSLTSLVITQKFYMWDNWDYKRLNNPFAEYYKDKWVDDHYEMVDEYFSLASFYNDKPNNSNIIL